MESAQGNKGKKDLSISKNRIFDEHTTLYHEIMEAFDGQTLLKDVD